MIVLSSRHNNLPMPAPPRNVLYWSESVNGWWPRISRRHLACGGGWLSATPPDTVALGVGWITCARCGADVAEIQRRRPYVVTPEQWAALPVEQSKRQPASVPVPEPATQKPCPGSGEPCGAMIDLDHERCRSCWLTIRFRASQHMRLVALLEDGQPLHRVEIAERLGIPLELLQNAIKRARTHGYQFVRAGATYRLAGVRR